MKKILALVLAVVMMVGICAACAKTPASSQTVSQTESKADVSSTAEPKKPVTIRYYYPQSCGVQSKTGEVAAKLTEILSKMPGYEHITMELVPQAEKTYATNITLDETAGVQIDLVATYALDFATMANAGSFTDLKDLLEKHPDITKELPDWLIKMGQFKGTQYYVPTYQQASNGYFFIAPNVYWEASGKTADEARNVFQKGTLSEKLDFMEAFCRGVRETTGSKTKWLRVPLYHFTGELMEYIDANYGQLILREGKTPEYRAMTEDMKTIFEYSAKWYKEGLIHPDVMTYKKNDYSMKNFMNDESLVYDFSEGSCSEEMILDKNSWTKDIPATAVFTSDHWYIGSKWAAGGNAIHSTSKNPDDAMSIIELLMTTKGEEFYNTLCWGLEGTHWNWVDKDNKRIETLEFSGSQGGSDGTYTTWKWAVGNTFNAWKNQAVADGSNEYILNEIHNGKTTVTSPMMGYTWDLTDLRAKIDDLKTIDDEYFNQLLNGINGDKWESVYNEYMTKLKKAGVQEVLDNLTKQYNDYTSSKK